MSEKKLYTYLYIANFPKDADLFKKMFEEYIEKSFDTESRLLIVIDKPEEKIKYIEPLYQGNFAWTYCHISLFTKADVLVFDWQTLIKQADCYIVGSNEYETSYVNFAFDNDLDIISSHAKTVFHEMPIVKEKVQVKEQLKLAANEIVKAYPPQDWDYMLYHVGFGESIIFFYWMKEYKKTNPRKLLILCSEEYEESMLEESPYIDATMTIPHILMGYINVYLTKQYNNIKNFSLLQLLPLSEKPYINPTDNVLTYSNEGMVSCMVRNLLGIETEKQVVKYDVNISPAKKEKAENLFKELKLREGRTVFLVPDGFTNLLTPDMMSFWKYLIQNLRNSGYDVVVRGQKEVFKGVKSVFLPAWETVIFIGLCGNLITIPTGISYIAAIYEPIRHININMLYKNGWEKTWRNNWVVWANYILPFIMKNGRDFINKAIGWDMKNFIDGGLKSDNVSFNCHIVHNWDEKLADKLIENIKEDEKNQK